MVLEQVLAPHWLLNHYQVSHMKHISFMAMLALATLPVLAQAHAHLNMAAPSDGSVVNTAPETIMLMFSESAHLTALSIQKEGDAQPQKIESLPKEASDHFMIPAPKLEPGVYTVKYRVVAAADNHVSSGTIRFTLSPDAKATPRKTSEMKGMDMKHSDSAGK
jgi:methionine-rich copper-binding protein CopC